MYTMSVSLLFSFFVRHRKNFARAYVVGDHVTVVCVRMLLENMRRHFKSR